MILFFMEQHLQLKGLKGFEVYSSGVIRDFTDDHRQFKRFKKKINTFRSNKSNQNESAENIVQADDLESLWMTAKLNTLTAYLLMIWRQEKHLIRSTTYCSITKVVGMIY